LSVPTGWGGDRPAEATKAFVQRQHTVTGSSVSVTAHVNSILFQSQAVLAVILGESPVTIHFRDDGAGGGTASFVVTSGADGRVTLSAPGDPSATTITGDVDAPLHVGVHIVSREGEKIVAYGRVIPMRSDAHSFELMMPGTVSNDLLGWLESATIDVKVAR
jgi:hypothetical protein